MAKYRVILEATAVVIQEQEIEAESYGEAGALALKAHTSSDWQIKNLFISPEVVGVNKEA